jgi:hypothetical protein
MLNEAHQAAKYLNHNRSPEDILNELFRDDRDESGD